MTNQQNQSVIMKDLLSATDVSPVKEGQMLEGKVAELGKINIFIDFGPLGIGVILGKEIKENPNILKEIAVGDIVKCIVLEPENEKGYIEVSFKEANKEISLNLLEEIKTNGQPIMAKVIQANRGGLVVEVMRQKGFLPVSQLAPEHYPRVEGGSKDKILQELNKFVGKELKVKVIDLDPREDKLIVSEKALNKEEIEEILNCYKIGEIHEGIVSAITDFGAFVKLEPVKELNFSMPEGLIHISELDWHLVKDPSQIVKLGEKVKIKILGFQQERLSLSLKALKEKPETQSQSANTSELSQESE
jgi:small subunit ribosomal protein S1